MADKKLSDLTAASDLTGTELFYADDGAADVKVTADQIKAFALGTDTPTLGANSFTAGQTITQGTANAPVLSSTGYSVTGNAATPMLDLSGEWNTTGNATGIKLNITNTASGNYSRLLDLQVAGASAFTVGKAADGLRTAGACGFAATPGDLLSTSDTFLSRRGPANLRLGLADAAAPAAQTLSVQSVVAGTSNAAGAHLTITGSQGTGNADGGSIIFQVAPKGTSGTAQNALTNIMSLSPDGKMLLGNRGVKPFIYGYLGIELNCRDNVGYPIALNGGTSGTFIGESGVLAWSTTQAATGRDVFLTRDAPNTLGLRNGVNANTFNIYNTYTSSTDFERLRLNARSDASVIIGTEKGSNGGSARALELQTDATTRLTLTTLGSVVVNTAAVATDATDGFLYVPTCTGTPTGTPATQTGTAPIVVDTTNNKLYFYSGGAWRDAGP